MQLILLESPYAGDIVANVLYARQCVLDSLGRGEAPLASHLLYPHRQILDDKDITERELGISAGLAWREVADAIVYYIDRGWSPGMSNSWKICYGEGLVCHIRKLDGPTISQQKSLA